MWSIWKCWDCGYQGAVVLEDGEMADEIREKFLEKLRNEKLDDHGDNDPGSKQGE